MVFLRYMYILDKANKNQGNGNLYYNSETMDTTIESAELTS